MSAGEVKRYFVGVVLESLALDLRILFSAPRGALLLELSVVVYTSGFEFPPLSVEEKSGH
jgi:hypothetical protein